MLYYLILYYIILYYFILYACIYIYTLYMYVCIYIYIPNDMQFMRYAIHAVNCKYTWLLGYDIWKHTSLVSQPCITCCLQSHRFSAHRLLPQGSHPVGLAAIAGNLGLQRTTDDTLQKAHIDETTRTICTWFLWETTGSHGFRVVLFSLLQGMGVFRGMSVSQPEQSSTIPKTILTIRTPFFGTPVGLQIFESKVWRVWLTTLVDYLASFDIDMPRFQCHRPRHPEIPGCPAKSRTSTMWIRIRMIHQSAGILHLRLGHSWTFEVA